MELFVRSKGILSRECVVLPESSKRDAIQEDATANTIFPTDLKEEMIVVQRNVLPVPPCP